MTWQFFNSTLTSSAVTVNLGTTDSAYIGRLGFIGTTGAATGIFGTGSNQIVQVEGTVVGATGINLGTNLSNCINERILVTATGVVSSEGYAVQFKSTQSTLVNFGLIDGLVGIGMTGTLSGSGSLVENHGTIHGSMVAVSCNNSSTTITIVNTGLIDGETTAITGSNHGDILHNMGSIIGTVSFGVGADSYDGRGGTVQGTIFGNLGSDTFRPGAGTESIDGGGDIDTLDFHTGGAIKVALDGSFANTGAATDDDYFNIENIIGSRAGADALTGDAGANGLSGLGGADKLVGGLGNDTLIGGRGADILTGGLGDDQFVFTALTDGADRISDYHSAVGDLDCFFISVSLGGGLVAGVLDPTLFQTRADTVAQDLDDRFILNTVTHTLWFDANGSDAGGLTLIATLQAGAVLAAGDILLG